MMKGLTLKNKAASAPTTRQAEDLHLCPWGGFKIAVLDRCSVVESPAEIHTELNRRFAKMA